VPEELSSRRYVFVGIFSLPALESTPMTIIFRNDMVFFFPNCCVRARLDAAPTLSVVLGLTLN
jgi:hypothetical protein